MLVLEDSRKVGFGGGQKGSLEVLSALRGRYDLWATDSDLESPFARRAGPLTGHPVIRLAASGSIVGGRRGSFSIGPAELVAFPFLTLRNLLHLSRWLKRNSLHAGNCILYAPLKKTLVLAWLLSLRTRIPFVYHARTLDDRGSPFFGPLRRMLARAALVICVSQAVLENLRAPRSVRLYNPIAMPPGAAVRSIRDKPIIHVAAFAALLPLKGLDHLLRASALLKAPGRVHLHLYGRGPQEALLRGILPENATLHGFTDEVERLLESEVDLTCTPSIIPEAFGRVPLEGYAHGIPAIATRLGGQAEITRDGVTGLLVPPADPHALAAAIDFFLDHPQVYEAMSAQALAYARDFDLQRFQRHVRELFDGLRASEA